MFLWIVDSWSTKVLGFENCCMKLEVSFKRTKSTFLFLLVHIFKCGWRALKSLVAEKKFCIISKWRTLGNIAAYPWRVDTTSFRLRECIHDTSFVHNKYSEGICPLSNHPTVLLWSRLAQSSSSTSGSSSSISSCKCLFFEYSPMGQIYHKRWMVIRLSAGLVLTVLNLDSLFLNFWVLSVAGWLSLSIWEHYGLRCKISKFLIYFMLANHKLRCLPTTMESK